MLPLIPYSGILRPAILIAFFFLTVVSISVPQKKSFHRKTVVAAFSLYLILLAYLTFLSRDVGIVYSYRLSPFAALRAAFTVDNDSGWIRLSNHEALEGIALNILLFMPMGYLLPQMFSKMRLWQVMSIGFLTTVCIEVGQLITKLGMFDFDDILNNVLGTGLGLIIAKVLKKGAISHK